MGPIGPIGLIWLTLGLAAARGDDPLPPVRVLIVDGQNNHDWRATTPLLKEILEETGRFAVEVATSPPAGGDMTAFRPPFDPFDAILLNYNGDPWPEETHKALEAAVSGGKGLVVVHAANNAFTGRAEYDSMIGLGWRPKSYGPRLEIDNDGTVTRVGPSVGPDSGHGRRHEFVVVVRDGNHPITAGLPAVWMHARDELYHGLRGPAENMTILATAYDDPHQGGTGSQEPVAWTVAYGKGRVFHTPLGHDREAMRCIGFITLLTRGTEWAATGRVTIPIPADFPTIDRPSKRGGWWADMEERHGKSVVRFGPFAIVLLVFAILWCRRRRTRAAVPK